MKTKISILLLFSAGICASTLTFTTTAPDSNDSSIVIAQKTLQAINANTIARLGAVANTGSISPEGVTTASPGAGYFDTALNKFYLKASGSGNTGWVLIFTVQ